MKMIMLAEKQDVDTLVEAFYSIKKLATDKESLLGEKMPDEEVFNVIRAKCNDAISYIKHALATCNNEITYKQ